MTIKCGEGTSATGRLGDSVFFPLILPLLAWGPIVVRDIGTAEHLYLSSVTRVCGSSRTIQSFGASELVRADREQLILFGGYDSSLQMSSTYKYDPPTRTWTAVQTLSRPPSRHGHVAVVSGNRVFVHGGACFQSDLIVSSWGNGQLSPCGPHVRSGE